MTRHILIDNASGFIWGDTVTFRDPVLSLTPIGAARWIDNRLGAPDRVYVEHGPNYRPPINATAYFVYAAPADFPAIVDGQSETEIQAVERDCELVAIVTCGEAQPRSYAATLRHHSIARARRVEISGTLAQAMQAADDEFGDQFLDYEIVIFDDREQIAASRLVRDAQWTITEPDR